MSEEVDNEGSIATGNQSATTEAQEGAYCDISDRVTPGADYPLPRRKTRRHQELARRRQQTFLEKRRQQKRRRVMVGRVRSLIRLGCLALIIFGLYSFLTNPCLLLDIPRFALKNHHLITDHEIRPYITPFQGKAIYEIDPRSLAERLKARYTILDQVHVRRYLFPARLQITFLEKTPWAEVYESPAAPVPYALLTQDMQHKYQMIPLKEYHFSANSYPPRSLAKVILPRYIPIKPHFMAKLDILAYQMKSIQGLEFLYVDSTQPDQISAVFREIGVRVGKLEPTTQERLERLIPLIPKIQEMQGKISWVDLRWSNQVTFRKKQETHDSPASDVADITVADPATPDSGTNAAATPQKPSPAVVGNSETPAKMQENSLQKAQPGTALVRPSVSKAVRPDD